MSDIKKWILFLFIFSGINLSFYAKIKAPDILDPVIYHDIKITANHEKPGFISIYSLEDDRLIEEIRIYRFVIIPFMEEDVQWVFITRMELTGDQLIITNSKNNVYVLDLLTKKVKKSNHK